MNYLTTQDGIPVKPTNPLDVKAAAGANVIGKVGIDQTTPGTTNLVQIGGTLPAFAATPAVTVSGSSVLLAGTGTAPLSGANAAAIAANACNAVVVQNDPDSTVDLMVGNSITVVPLQLVPGQSVTIPVSNTSLVFVRSNNAATNATYNWLAV